MNTAHTYVGEDTGAVGTATVSGTSTTWNAGDLEVGSLGGQQGLLKRVSHTDQVFDAILYFLVFDPKAREPRDPRPRLRTHWVAPGIGRTLARTCWCDDGRLFAVAEWIWDKIGAPELVGAAR